MRNENQENNMQRRGFTSASEERRENSFSWRPSDDEAKAPRAFTLIETLVAISVLLVSLAGPLSIAAQALNSAYYARDQVTAYYLAQEAIEYVRAVRDQNYLAGNPWLTGLDGNGGPSCFTDECVIDFPNFEHAQCGSDCPKLLLSPTEGLFNHDSGNASIFTRQMTLEYAPNTSDEVIIRVTVSWISRGLNRSFELKENIFDWL